MCFIISVFQSFEKFRTNTHVVVKHALQNRSQYFIYTSYAVLFWDIFFNWAAFCIYILKFYKKSPIIFGYFFCQVVLIRSGAYRGFLPVFGIDDVKNALDVYGGVYKIYSNIVLQYNRSFCNTESVYKIITISNNMGTMGNKINHLSRILIKIPRHKDVHLRTKYDKN